MDLLKHLNLNQKLAVIHGKGPQLILGGAGTGKTLVIATRIAYLMRERDILPSNILVVTSTDMAANKMIRQVRNILNGGEVPLITSFQTLCLSILRRDINDLGFQSDFGIYDDGDSKLLLKDIIEGMDLDENKFPPHVISAKIYDYKNRGQSPEDINTEATSDIYKTTVVRIYAAYQERLKKCNALDFGDLLIQSVRLLTDFPEVRLRYQELFQWVMVDNYENSTTVQYQLINLLLGERKNLCLAEDHDMTEFTLWFGRKPTYPFGKDILDSIIVRLELNYRSTASIVKAANEVAEARKIDPFMMRTLKPLWTENQDGEKVRYIRVETDLDEGRFVSKEVGRLRALGIPLNEMAVFYRTDDQSRQVEEALVSEVLPYLISDGIRFYDLMEIKYILAYLRLLDNPADEASLKRIINFPTCGINNSTGGSFYEAVHKTDRPRAKVAAFAAMMESFRELTYKLPELVKAVMEESGYLAHLKKSRDEDDAYRLENLGQLLEVVEGFSEIHPGSGLPMFLEYITSHPDLEQEKSCLPSITLMNLHDSIGLEFRAVFIIGMEESLLPHVSMLDNLYAIEEERRLCYAGMTRASERLYLLNARRRHLFGHEQCNPPSRFLKDIPPELLSAEEILETEKAIDRQPPEPNLNEENVVVHLGMRVRHGKFGVGTINKIEGGGDDQKVIVWFDSEGPKKLMLRFADLKTFHNLQSVNPVPVHQDLPNDESGYSPTPLTDYFAEFDNAQEVQSKGSRLNYLYFRKCISSPSEVLSELTDEQLHLRVNGKYITENNSAIVEIRRIRQRAGNDNLMLLQCLDGRPLTPSEIDEKRKEGYVSNAELRLFQMLKAMSDTNWSIYHQVDVGGLLNPLDIVAVTADFQIYAIELDGPHHLLSSQRINDDRRDALLLNRGFNVIRVGYEKYALSCAQAAQEILLVLRGQVKPENTWRPDVRVNIDNTNSEAASKHPDFYKNRPQTEPSNDGEPHTVMPRRYCYIYCQSTGISEKSQIVDFCLLVEEGEVRKQYYSKIKPNCPIESKATTLHGISDRDVNDCPSLHSYLEQYALKKILEASDTLVITYDWDFMGRVIRNSALRYLNWQNINLYSVVDTVRLKHGLKPISTILEAVAALGLSSEKFKRYDSKDYARLVHAMFFVATNRECIKSGLEVKQKVSDNSKKEASLGQAHEKVDRTSINNQPLKALENLKLF